VTKGAKDAEDGDILICETDVKEKLVQSKANREDTRDKERLKEVAEIISCAHRGVSEKAEDRDQRCGESGPGSDTIREGETAPDKEEEKGCVEWVASEILTLEDDDEESEARDTDTEELREREGNLVQCEAHIL
jgi:hypothetical protein